MSQPKQPVYRREVYERYAAAMDAEDRSPPAPPHGTSVLWLAVLGLAAVLVVVLRFEVPNRVDGTMRRLGDRIAITIPAADRDRISHPERIELRFASTALRRVSIERPQLEWSNTDADRGNELEFTLPWPITESPEPAGTDPVAVTVDLDPIPLYSMLPGAAWFRDPGER